VLGRICDGNLRPRRHTSPQIWQPEDEDDVASPVQHLLQQAHLEGCEFYEMFDEGDEDIMLDWEDPVKEVPNSVHSSFHCHTSSTVTSVGNDSCEKLEKVPASHSTEVESLRTFVSLHAGITRSLEKRVADLETQLLDQIDERKASMLNYALVMKKVTRLEARCSELESLDNLRPLPHAEQPCEFESRFEQLEAQLEAFATDIQPVQLACRLEHVSMAAEKTLEEAQRISTELKATASRFGQQLGFVEACQEQLATDGSSCMADAGSYSLSLQTPRTSHSSNSGDMPTEVMQTMEIPDVDKFAENRFRMMLLDSAHLFPNSQF